MSHHPWMRAAALGLHLGVLACSPPGPARTAEEEIQDMLLVSAAAWNAGDLDGFMASYAPDDRVTFVGNRELLQGHEAVRANYAPLFEPGAMRDSLRYEDMRIMVIDPLHAIAYARWVLYRADGPARSGPFTLVVERRGRAWVILHDHSSED